MSPTTTEEYFEKSAHDSACRLGDEYHVGVKGVAIEFKLGDVGLKQNVDFCGRIVLGTYNYKLNILKIIKKPNKFLIYYL